MQKNITGVVMAAGLGSRLGELTKKIPKALIEVEGKPLIEYAINFLKIVGVDKIVVVGGFCYSELKVAVRKIDKKITVIENKFYKKGNLYTLDTVIHDIDNSFLLMNVDHIYHNKIVKKVATQLDFTKVVAFTDDDRELGDDDMKVLTNNDQSVIKSISKKLDSFDRGYVGMSFVGIKQLFRYKKSVERAKSQYGEDAVAENVLQVMADLNDFDVSIGDISGSKWLEIDFADELKSARKELKKNFKNYF